MQIRTDRQQQQQCVPPTKPPRAIYLQPTKSTQSTPTTCTPRPHQYLEYQTLHLPIPSGIIHPSLSSTLLTPPSLGPRPSSFLSPILLVDPPNFPACGETTTFSPPPYPPYPPYPLLASPSTRGSIPSSGSPPPWCIRHVPAWPATPADRLPTHTPPGRRKKKQISVGVS